MVWFQHGGRGDFVEFANLTLRATVASPEPGVASPDCQSPQTLQGGQGRYVQFTREPHEDVKQAAGGKLSINF
jgi:hypothetical protein